MVRFGQNPSQGTLLKASQFLAEELPVRLAHRVKELDELPEQLNEMPSIKRVKEWYAQSFEVSSTLSPPSFPSFSAPRTVNEIAISGPFPLPPHPSLPASQSLSQVEFVARLLCSPLFSMSDGGPPGERAREEGGRQLNDFQTGPLVRNQD